MKTCAVCGVDFPEAATGPWCHSCVGRILDSLSIKESTVIKLHETVARLRQQLREAKAAGKTPNDTEVPGPYWGLEL